VQCRGALGQHPPQLLVVDDDVRRGPLLVGELAVDRVEELHQVLRVRPGWPDTVLVVVDLVQQQAKVAFLFLLADFGEELRLRSAGPTKWRSPRS
jgi:hypothetical protein